MMLKDLKLHKIVSHEKPKLSKRTLKGSKVDLKGPQMPLKALKWPERT